jgi:hypothetical protein
MGPPVEISFVMRVSEYCCMTGASSELVPARTAAVRLTPSRLVRIAGLLPFSPVAPRAMDNPNAEALEETDVLLVLAGHPGAQHPAHPTVAGAAFLLWRLALSTSGDLGSSLLANGLLLAASLLLSLLLASSSRFALLLFSSPQASHIFFSRPFSRHSMRCLRRHSSVVPLAISLVIPLLVSSRDFCSYSILVQTSLLLSLSRLIILMY